VFLAVACLQMLSPANPRARRTDGLTLSPSDAAVERAPAGCGGRLKGAGETLHRALLLERHRLAAVDACPALGVSAANEDEVLGSRRAIEAEE